MTSQTNHQVAFILGTDSISFVVNGKDYVLAAGDRNYAPALQAIRDKDTDKLVGLLDINKAVADYSDGHITIKGGQVFYDTEALADCLSRRMLQMFDLKLPLESLVKFVENLMQNPSHTSVQELYSFLDANDLPITEDGHFLAYKNVAKDFLDIHSGTVLNKAAAVMTDDEKAKFAEPQTTDNGVTVQVKNGVTHVNMARNHVDDERHNHCSTGLHFCSKDYLPHFNSHGGHTMILKINPRDVVSIPADYNGSKGRCCAYTIVGELGVDTSSIEGAPVKSI